MYLPCVQKSSQHRQIYLGQWRNKQVGEEGGTLPPETSDREISVDLPGKERQGKMDQERRKIKKMVRWKIENGRRKSYKMRRGPPLFFFFSLFKTTEICFGSTKMGIFYQERAFHISRQEKNQEIWLCPIWKIFLLGPWLGGGGKLAHIGRYCSTSVCHPQDSPFSPFFGSRDPLISSPSSTPVIPLTVFEEKMHFQAQFFKFELFFSSTDTNFSKNSSQENLGCQHIYQQITSFCQGGNNIKNLYSINPA